MMTAATVSGPSNSIFSAMVSASSCGESPCGMRKVLVFGTWVPPGVSGSNGVRRLVMPVAESAPRLVPWYAISRATTFVLLGLPVSLWY